MTGWLALFRYGLLGQALDARSVLVAAVLTLGALLVGTLYFRQVETTIADII